jgi:hypothetical protein
MLNGATLHATTTGMQFLKGKVCINGVSTLETEVDAGVSIDQGITFGDKTLPNDCVLEIKEGTELHIGQGSLYYRNVSSSSLIMANVISKIHVLSGASLVILEDFYVGDGRLDFDANSTLGRATGKDIIGSIHVGGPMTYRTFSSNF